MLIRLFVFCGLQTPLFQITSFNMLWLQQSMVDVEQNCGEIISPSFRATPRAKGRHKEADAVEIGRENRFHTRESNK